MASEIRANQIQSRTGVSTVSLTDTGPVISGVTTVQGTLTVDGGVTADVTGNVTGDITSSGTSTFDVISGVSTIGVTTVHLTGINDLNYPTAGSLGHRNLILNGGMKISARGLTTSFTTSGSDDNYTLDRWEVGARVQSFEYTVTRESEGPVAIGSSHSAKLNIDAVTSESASSNLVFQQKIEGQFLQHLKYGKSSAEPLALSFYVKSNKTGTYGSQLLQYSGTGSSSYSAFREFTINTADTWERKTLTFTGNTVSHIRNTSTVGLAVQFHLHAGPDDQLAASTATAANDWTTSGTLWKSTTNQTNLADTINNYIQFAGVQLELGTRHTEFEITPYSTELSMCQRYYQIWKASDPDFNGRDAATNSHGTSGNAYCTLLGNGSVHDEDDCHISMSLPVEMRDAPTATLTDARVISGNSIYDNTTIIQINNSSRKRFSVFVDNEGTMTAKDAVSLVLKGSNAKLALDAEI